MTTDLGDSLGSLAHYLKERGFASRIENSALHVNAASSSLRVPEATTIVALAYADAQGVIVAADRRASAGHRIAKDDMLKVFVADRLSAVGIAGAAGIGVELARLFALELEHVEKIERAPLSHEGKVRRLSVLVSDHLGLAFQGLGAVPLLAGYDERQNRVRLHTFDATGGVYEEECSAVLGSGSDIAQAALDARLRGLRETPAASLSGTAAKRAVLGALDAASRRDSATSGLRGEHLPVLVDVNSAGARYVDASEVAQLVGEELP